MVRHTGGIGVLREKSLHAGIKAWYSRPQDALEVRVGSYLVDIARDDMLVEVQTGGLAGLRPKLDALLAERPVRLVYPIAEERWIVTLSPEGEILRRRRSPRRGRLADVFRELVYIAPLLTRGDLSLDVLLTREEEVRCADGRGSWRRKGISLVDRRLLDVVAVVTLSAPEEFGALLPCNMPAVFTTEMLARAIGVSRRVGQRCAYALRLLGVLTCVGKQGHAMLYARSTAAAPAPATSAPAS